MRLLTKFIAGIVLTATTANAEVINFDSFVPGGFLAGTSGSFQLTATNAQIEVAGTIPGSATQTFLQNNANALSTLSITRIGGGLFSLTNFLWGFDALGASNAAVASTVWSGALSETFRPAGAIVDTGLTPFAPSGDLNGVNISQLNFTLSNNGGGSFGLDSINLELVGAATVPEPSSIAFLMLGGAGFWLKRRRQVA